MTKATAAALAPVVDRALGTAQEAGAVVPAASKAGGISLYDAFDDLQALIDTEEGGIDEALQAEFDAAMTAGREVAAAKVDRCLQFHAALKKEIEFCGEEEDRIGAKKKQIKNALDRFRGYLLLVTDRFGERKPKKKGSDELGPPKLEGRTGTISTRAGGSETVIEDAVLIPERFLKSSATMSFEQWSALLDVYELKHGAAARVALLQAIKVEQTVDAKAVAAAMEAGEEVPGADVRFKDDVLVIR